VPTQALDELARQPACIAQFVVNDEQGVSEPEHVVGVQVQPSWARQVDDWPNDAQSDALPRHAPPSAHRQPPCASHAAGALKDEQGAGVPRHPPSSGAHPMHEIVPHDPASSAGHCPQLTANGVPEHCTPVACTMQPRHDPHPWTASHSVHDSVSGAPVHWRPASPASNAGASGPASAASLPPSGGGAAAGGLDPELHAGTQQRGPPAASTTPAARAARRRYEARMGMVLGIPRGRGGAMRAARAADLAHARSRLTAPRAQAMTG
jgi:hypothetical protein